MITSLHRLLLAATAALAVTAVCAGTAVAAPGDPILVFSGNTSMAPGTTYAGVGTAAGRPISSTTVMPGSLAGNECVMLNLNQSAFSGPQIATLSTYVTGGGKVIAIGENDNYVNNVSLRNLVTALGGSMVLNNASIDSGFGDTTSIDVDPLTRDVDVINYAASTTVTVTTPARSLVRSRSDATATIMAAQAIGSGTLVVLGDANAFTTPTGDAGVFVANLCGDRRNTASSVDCTPTDAVVGTTITCVATVTDTDTGTAVTPTGDVNFTDSGTGTGTFGGTPACTLAATGTLGTASCSVSYVASAAGTQTLNGAYAGTNTAFSSAGADTTVATPIPAPELPPATPTPTPAPTVTPSPVTTEPATCTSRRSVRINWRVPARSGISGIKVTINGKAYKTLDRDTRKVTVVLDGRKDDSVTVRVVARTKGESLRTVRKYETCAQKVEGDGPKSLYLSAA